MLIFPAVDLYAGKVVRLFKGDYAQMTVYGENPPAVAEEFKRCGAEWMHIVDLEGAKDGTTPNFDTVLAIKERGGLRCEIGGGIRTMETIERYVSGGMDRVILGTAAVTEPGFVEKAIARYGDKIAVGIDIRDGFVAIKGWTEKSAYTAVEFGRQMRDVGVQTLICTDISRDGAMRGTNHELYRMLMEELKLQIIASGGVSSISDVARLKEAGLYGAIIGKAYYNGAVRLDEAIEVAK